MKLIFLHGMPGVGKLTIARELATLTGYKLFHNHLTVDLVLSLFEFGSRPFVELREQIWIDAFAQACEAKLDGLIFTFAFERTVRDQFVPNVVDLVASRGGEVIFVNLVCEVAELEKRLTDPAREKFGKLTSVDIFRQLNNNGTFATPDYVPDRIKMDTTNILPT
ncbi:MAG TPA: AAA family ATPase, partial [Pyrinomonadaceae bacterium]